MTDADKIKRIAEIVVNHLIPNGSGWANLSISHAQEIKDLVKDAGFVLPLDFIDEYADAFKIFGIETTQDTRIKYNSMKITNF